MQPGARARSIATPSARWTDRYSCATRNFYTRYLYGIDRSYFQHARQIRGALRSISPTADLPRIGKPVTLGPQTDEEGCLKKRQRAFLTGGHETASDDLAAFKS